MGARGAGIQNTGGKGPTVMRGNEETMTSAFLCEVAGRPVCWGGQCVCGLGKWRELQTLSVGNGRVGPRFLNAIITSKTNIPEDGFILFESDT